MPARLPDPARPSPVAASGDSGSRRTFLKHSTAAMVGGAIAGVAAAPKAVHAHGEDVLRVGLVGCGGRGCGAAVNAAAAGPDVRITALADLFPDKVTDARAQLQPELGSQFDVTDDRAFAGFDAYQQLIDSGVDVVLLATPPHFRPAHLAAAVQAGKHVFCEKPVAVDPTGVRKVLETCEDAEKKGLNIVSGLCWRYHPAVQETIRRIREDKAIGDIVAIQENYLTGELWHRGREADWSEMEYQLRNWLYFTWLSGDHIVEQHVHSLDKALWLMGDEPPSACFGLGGRQKRTDDQWGHIFDHFAVCYEWPNGTKTYAYTRQMSDPQIHGDVQDYVMGTQGRAVILRPHRIEGPDGTWNYRGPGLRANMYDAEHRELFGAIRDGRTINNGKYMSYSTLMAIMGREACYTGQRITWDQALNSTQDLSPQEYVFGDAPATEVAVPGFTRFS